MFKRSCLALAAAAAFMIPALSLAQMTIEERLAPGQPPLVIANLGHSGEFPENSLASIQQAIDRGIDMVKVDVQVTRDGQYVLMGSKAAFLRTTNVERVFPEGTGRRSLRTPAVISCATSRLRTSGDCGSATRRGENTRCRRFTRRLS